MIYDTSETMVIALDVMGGDHAPLSVLKGADAIAQKHPALRMMLFGDQSLISPILDSCPHLKAASEVHHTADVIADDEKPSVALRRGKKSSMRLAIDAVKHGEAQAVVSAGNTGALMAMSKIALRTLPGIDRPAIIAMMPTLKGASVMLDLGANADTTADQLIQFSLMGQLFAKSVLGKEQPSVGLLNIGSEDVKGNETVKLAGQELKENHPGIHYHGFVEGHDIAEGTVDVVVTDGFTGNIALKTAEGTAKICKRFLKQAFKSSFFARLGFMIAGRALKRLFKQIDHRRYNGAMFVGLNGIVVKSHGSADPYAFSKAIDVAVELIAHRINDQITTELAHYSDGEVSASASHHQ